MGDRKVASMPVKIEVVGDTTHIFHLPTGLLTHVGAALLGYVDEAATPLSADMAGLAVIGHRIGQIEPVLDVAKTLTVEVDLGR